MLLLQSLCNVLKPEGSIFFCGPCEVAQHAWGYSTVDPQPSTKVSLSWGGNTCWLDYGATQCQTCTYASNYACHCGNVTNKAWCGNGFIESGKMWPERDAFQSENTYIETPVKPGLWHKYQAGRSKHSQDPDHSKQLSWGSDTLETPQVSIRGTRTLVYVDNEFLALLDKTTSGELSINAAEIVVSIWGVSVVSKASAIRVQDVSYPGKADGTYFNFNRDDIHRHEGQTTPTSQ